MTNLLKETMDILNKNGKTLDDIVWISSSDGYITLETFKKLADVEYDSRYGVLEVAIIDLVIEGDDFYMARGKYNDSERWEYYSKENGYELRLFE